MSSTPVSGLSTNDPARLPAVADAVIIGGGVLGCACACHLAAAGLKPLLLERRGLAQASTSRAAGLLTRLRSRAGLMQLVRATYQDIPQLEAETGASLGLRRTGSIHLASSAAARASHVALLEVAAGQGETVAWLAPEEVRALLPWIRLGGDEQALFTPADAFIDGYALAMGYAQAARLRGARLLEYRPVHQVLAGQGRVTGVRCGPDTVHAPVVIDAAGAWANLLAWPLGTAIPMAPVRSQYWITAPAEVFPDDMPFLVLPDAKAYARPEGGGLLFGFREARGRYADPRQLPEDFQGHVVAGDADGWAGLEEGAPAFTVFFPEFLDTAIAHYISGYSMYVPDGLSAVGPLPGIDGFYSGAGCSGGGVAMAGGLGRALAQMVTGAALTFEMAPHHPARFGPFDPFSPEWGQRCADARSRKTSG
jgi:4-methylaminobutanoate oxidase (formaldehyde-forming)